MKRITLFLILALTPVLLRAQYGISKPGVLKDSAGFYTTMPAGHPLAAWLITTLPCPGNDSTQLATGTNSGMLWYKDWYRFNQWTDTTYSQASESHTGFMDYASFFRLWYLIPDTNGSRFATVTRSGSLWYEDFNRFKFTSDVVFDNGSGGKTITIAPPGSYKQLELGSAAGLWAFDSTSGAFHPMFGLDIGSPTYPIATGYFSALSAPGDTVLGPFASSATTGLLQYDDFDTFNNKLSPSDSSWFFAALGQSGLLSYLDWFKFDSKPDTTIGPFADENSSSSGILRGTALVKIMSAIDSLNSKVSGILTCGAGDSATVGIAGITYDNTVVIVSYAEKVTTSEIPAGWAINATDQLTIYGSDGKRMSYFLARK